VCQPGLATKTPEGFGCPWMILPLRFSTSQITTAVMTSTAIPDPARHGGGIAVRTRLPDVVVHTGTREGEREGGRKGGHEGRPSPTRKEPRIWFSCRLPTSSLHHKIKNRSFTSRLNHQPQHLCQASSTNIIRGEQSPLPHRLPSPILPSVTILDARFRPCLAEISNSLPQKVRHRAARPQRPRAASTGTNSVRTVTLDSSC